MEDDRVAILEAQLAQAKLIAEESDKKYEEVKYALTFPINIKNNVQMTNGYNDVLSLLAMSIRNLEHNTVSINKYLFLGIYENECLFEQSLIIYIVPFTLAFPQSSSVDR